MNRISAIVNGKRSITADTALRFARYFGTSAEYWMNLQVAYDLVIEEHATREQIDREVMPRHAAGNVAPRLETSLQEEAMRILQRAGRGKPPVAGDER
jgi:plasmid maintenance system antidote protein VapI